METVLVTGAAGFIGSNVVRILLEKGYRVIGLDNFDDTYDPRIKEAHIAPFAGNEHFVLHRTDVRDMDAMRAIFEKEHPAYVIHLAAKVDTRNAVEHPYDYVSVNVEGTLNVLELGRACGVQNIVLASTSSVYGNTTEMPWSETLAADKPLSPYGSTKRLTEMLAYSYHHNFGMNITCLRYFNAYGENNRPTLVPYVWTEKILRDQEIEMSGDGSRKRDYTYIDDVVDATIRAMEKPLGFEVINVGNSTPSSLKELLATIEHATGKKALVKSRPSHAASVEMTYADVRKAKELLGWEPKTSLSEGVEKLVTWFRANRLKEGE